MRAVDTNVLVRLLVGDQRAQFHAAEDFVGAGAWVSHLVLVETIWVLSSVYEIQWSRLADLIGVLLEHQKIILQEPDVVAAALARFRTHRSLGFSDCMVLECARKAGHFPLGSFDKDLGKQDGGYRIPSSR